MSNPFSGSEIPGMNAMGDTLSFVKKLWGNMQVPGMVAPPMSVDELDKKIQDLKTVESWLTVNMNMLRGTIQALEVQRATIAALQSLGESFAQHAQQAGAMAEQAAATATATASQAGNNADWPMHPHATKTRAAEPDPDDEVDEDSADMPPDASAPEVKAEEVAASTPTEGTAKTEEKLDSSTAFVNPAAWWGLLQEQFKQAVSKAMEAEPVDSAGGDAAGVKKGAGKSTAAKTAKAGTGGTEKTAGKTGAAAKPAAKTATKTAVKPRATAKPVAKTSKAVKAR